MNLLRSSRGDIHTRGSGGGTFSPGFNELLGVEKTTNLPPRKSSIRLPLLLRRPLDCQQEMYIRPMGPSQIVRSAAFL